MELCSILILLSSCLHICRTYTIAVCRVRTPDDEQRNCPKHVEFHSKNKFEKSVHLVGFIVRIIHLLLPVIKINVRITQLVYCFTL